MALETRLLQKLAQQLVMTPQLQQAIKLLQYSNLELAAYVEQELERNRQHAPKEYRGQRQEESEAGVAATAMQA